MLLAVVATVSAVVGQKISRVTYAPYPFVDTDAELDVRFEPDRIVLTDPEGLEVTYPESYYALD